jgi:hypothetical protein
MGTTPANYLPIAVRNKSAGVNVIYPQNVGLSGLRSDEVLKQLLLPHADPMTHAVFLVGSVDVDQLVPAETTYAYMTAMVERAHERGAKAIVCTLPQWGALVSDPVRDALRVGNNSLSTANSAGADAVVDLVAAMGPYNAANFCADTRNPNDAANNNIIAPVIYAALTSI